MAERANERLADWWTCMHKEERKSVMTTGVRKLKEKTKQVERPRK